MSVATNRLSTRNGGSDPHSFKLAAGYFCSATAGYILAVTHLTFAHRDPDASVACLLALRPLACYSGLGAMILFLAVWLMGRYGSRSRRPYAFWGIMALATIAGTLAAWLRNHDAQAILQEFNALALIKVNEAQSLALQVCAAPILLAFGAFRRRTHTDAASLATPLRVYKMAQWYRWPLRGAAIFLLLSSVGGWTASRLMYLEIEKATTSVTLRSTMNSGAWSFYFIQRSNGPHPWVLRSFRGAYDAPLREWVRHMGFYFHYAPWNDLILTLPFWALTFSAALLLWYVWRKTRLSVASAAFPVIPNQPVMSEPHRP